VDPKLLISDPDPTWRGITDSDPTRRVISDPDPTLQIVSDPGPDRILIPDIFVKFSYFFSFVLKSNVL